MSIRVSLILCCAVVCLGGGPTFSSYVVELPAPALDLEVASLDAGSTPDALVAAGVPGEGMFLLSLEGLGDGRLQLAENLTALSNTGYLGTPRMALGDLVDDGFPEVGISKAFPNLLGGDGDLHYQSVGFLPTAGGERFDVDFGDVDGDGDLDSGLLVEDFGWFVDTGINQNDGALSGGSFFDAPGGPNFFGGSRLLFADVDGDADIETFVAGAGLAMTQAPFGGGNSTLDPTAQLRDPVAADLDGDGRLDLVTAAPEELSLHVLLNDGAGGFPTVDVIFTRGAAEALDVADLDNDGHLDLVAVNRDNARLVIFEGDGAGGFVPARRRPVSGDPVDVATADLEGDGDQDVIVAGGASAEVTVLLNKQFQVLPGR